ncbi:hypothetical protein QR680_001989 [Steinernema hermaphroditum]|uniref:Uncharacterized protein n=1 Tax=Steinernema hermaphroditum TaxID=289476 RepID=A0AA39LH95_9BILA|nr:hypothetical protein QR680_001989 [Steinernema hermaphroditum]
MTSTASELPTVTTSTTTASTATITTEYTTGTAESETTPGRLNYSSVGVPKITLHKTTITSPQPTLSSQIPEVYPSNKNLSCYENTTLDAISRYPILRCSCPPGEMKTENGTCKSFDVATFSAKITKVCDAGNVKADDEPSLIIAKLSNAFNRPVCVRKFGTPLILNTLCDGCNITDLQNMLSSSRGKNDPVRLRLSEVEAGACYEFNINDCDEKAQCVPDGLHYSCLCLPGTNDTTDGSGRHCDGVVIATSCHQFLGVCILFWILLLLLLLLLIPAAYMAYQSCRKKRRSAKKKSLQHRVIEVRPLSPSKRGSTQSNVLKTSSTSTLPIPTATSTQSAQKPSLGLTWKRPIPETIITVPSTSSKDYEIIEDAESVSSSEPEVSSLRSNKSIESMQRAELRTSAINVPTVPTKTETVIPVEVHSERRSSTRSEGVPTIWESFKILGKQYSRFDSAKSRKSSSASLDSLIRKSEMSRVLRPIPAQAESSNRMDLLRLHSTPSQPSITEFAMTQEPEVFVETSSPKERPEEEAESQPIPTVPFATVASDEDQAKLASMLGMSIYSSQSSTESSQPPKIEHQQKDIESNTVETPKVSEEQVPLFSEPGNIPTTEDIISMAAQNVALKATTDAIADTIGMTSSEELSGDAQSKAEDAEKKAPELTRPLSKPTKTIDVLTDESTTEELGQSLPLSEVIDKVESSPRIVAAQQAPKTVKPRKPALKPATQKHAPSTKTQEKRREKLPEKYLEKTPEKKFRREAPKVQAEPMHVNKPPAHRRRSISKPSKILERIEESDSVTTDNEVKVDQNEQGKPDKKQSPSRTHLPKVKPPAGPPGRRSPSRQPRETRDVSPAAKKSPTKTLPSVKGKVRRQWQTSDSSSVGEQNTTDMDTELSDDLKLFLGKVDLGVRPSKPAYGTGRKPIHSEPASRRLSKSPVLSDRTRGYSKVSLSCPQSARLPSELHPYKSKDNLFKSRLPVRQNKIEESLVRFNCTRLDDEFVGADIDIDLPGPFTIPVDFSELNRRRSLHGSHTSLHGSHIPRPLKPFSSDHDIHSKLGSDNRRYMSNLARKIANRRRSEHPAPTSEASTARTPRAMSQRDFGERPRWDSSPLREGELDKIPLDFALPSVRPPPPQDSHRRPQSEHASRWTCCDECGGTGPALEKQLTKRSRSLTSFFKRSKVSPSENLYWTHDVKQLRAHHWWSDE